MALTARERKLLEQITSYSMMLAEIDGYLAELQGIEYKLTPSYSADPMAGAVGNSRKVEDMALRVAMIQRQIEVRRGKESRIKAALVVLNSRERRLIEGLMAGLNLSGYARRNNIYKSHVYKIRDSAVKKMAAQIDGKYG